MTGWRPLCGALLLVLTLCSVAACGSGDGSKSKPKGQVVRFQKPTAPGPDPFTVRATDVTGPDRVQVGSGPYGGTGSDLVCDRELLIRSLKARPDRLRAWAEVVHVAPTYEAVAKYIRALKPVTLTRDTRVTNHSFVGGRATGYQAILQAGTAVLVDRYGVPRARCRCGNPLAEPVYVPEATCYGCPPNYHPPPECDPWSECYQVYEHPPPVQGTASGAPTGGGGTRQLNPQASFSPSSGQVGTAFTLSISGFSPNASVPFSLTRPDGVVENYSISTDGSGSGSYSFRPTGSDNVLGTYTATVRDPTGATASATATLVGSDSGGGGGGGGSGSQPPATTTTDGGSGQTTTPDGQFQP
ncbi:MAG: hypothetical protein QOE65_498 [Solirubrobacteraceae bacterium]|nr:hypothetical protein [Solirubrobacteraceae bacterium]